MDRLNEHDSDDMQEAVASNGDSRFRHLKSKLWDEYKPVLVNGVMRAECRHCHVHFSCRGGYLWQHYKICKAKEYQKPQDAGLRYGVEHLDEHNSDNMHAGVASDGDSKFTNVESKVWAEYKPVFVNGVIQRGECRYCHVQLSCSGGYFWQHYKAC